MDKELLGVITTIALVFAVCFGLNLKIRKDYNNDLNKYTNELENCNYKIDSLQNKLILYEETLQDYVDNGDKLLIKLDSLVTNIDSLQNELNVANFKIERVKYYNEIAAKNNNIKYLRGWINRVMEN